MAAQGLDVATRDRLLDAAEAIMLSRGFVASTVDGICSAAGLTKGSFFHYFRSKEELGVVLLERFADRQGAAFTAACSAIQDPLERAQRVIAVAIETARKPEGKGCLLGTFAQEISETHPELRQVCERRFKDFAAWLASDLVAAKELHCPTAAFDAASLGTYFLALVQGSLLLLKTNGERAAMERNLLHFRDYLKTLYGR